VKALIIKDNTPRDPFDTGMILMLAGIFFVALIILCVYGGQ
jgi:hypothetical protein